MIVNVLPQTVFIFLLVFARLGSMLMLLPALGEISVSPRIRLVLALGLVVILMPVVGPAYGVMPSTVGGLASIVISEMLVGFFIGVSARLVMSALQVAGTVIAFQTGLAFAQNVDPTQGIQSALVGSFLAVLAVVLIFATDMHHLMLLAGRDSYTLFVPGQVLPVGDFAEMAVNTVAGAFKLGVQIASPFVVFGLIFYLGLGILSRLMPQIQIFFIAMPANILLGFLLLALLLSGMTMWFLDFFEKTLLRFVI